MAMLRWSLGKGRRLSHSSAATEFDAPPEERVRGRDGEREFWWLALVLVISKFVIIYLVSAACVGVGAINL